MQRSQEQLQKRRALGWVEGPVPAARGCPGRGGRSRLPARREEEPRPCVGPSPAKALPEGSPRRLSQKALPEGSPSLAGFFDTGSELPSPERSWSAPGAAAGRAIIPRPWKPWCSSPVSVFGGLCGNQSRMDRYRYFIFNQRNMVVLGMFQIAFSTVCVTSGVIDGVFRTESELAKTRAPVWAGMVMGIPGVLALFSSQRKNPVLVNVLIVCSIISCVAIFIVIVYSSLTLNYGEEEELSSAPVHVIHTRFILNAVVKGANIAMLAVSICSAFSVLAMAYLGCRSLPCCSCYDSVTGMEWLQPNEDQNQSVEMICAVESPGGRIFNFTDRFPAQDVDAEEDTSKPPPFIRMT